MSLKFNLKFKKLLYVKKIINDAIFGIILDYVLKWLKQSLELSQFQFNHLISIIRSLNYILFATCIFKAKYYYSCKALTFKNLHKI